MYRNIPHYVKLPEFNSPKLEWELEEHIPGFHLRVIWKTHNNNVSFRGKHDEDMIPPEVFSSMFALFNIQSLGKLKIPSNHIKIELHAIFTTVSNKIHCTLIDVCVDDHYLDRIAVRLTAARLGVKTPPLLGHMTKSRIAELLADKPLSMVTRLKLSKCIGRVIINGEEKIMQVVAKDMKG